jgi:ABC-type spermidine/putrescine transport system permease subunit I
MIAALINQQVMKENQWNGAAAHGVVLLLITLAGLLLVKLVGSLGAGAKKRSTS